MPTQYALDDFGIYHAVKERSDSLVTPMCSRPEFMSLKTVDEKPDEKLICYDCRYKMRGFK